MLKVASRFFPVVLLAVLALAPAASAQTTTAGKVVGTVTDQTGAVVPKADVQLQNVETGIASQHEDRTTPADLSFRW